MFALVTVVRRVLFRSPYNAQLKVTIAKYYIPSGRCIQALDYTHRNPDGSVGKIPDSLVSSFKTKNGRTVQDGGGILPDVLVERSSPSKVGQSLLEKGLIFDYATVYRQRHDSIARSEEHTSELQSLMRISYAVFCLKKKKKTNI